MGRRATSKGMLLRHAAAAVLLLAAAPPRSAAEWTCPCLSWGCGASCPCACPCPCGDASLCAPLANAPPTSPARPEVVAYVASITRNYLQYMGQALLDVGLPVRKLYNHVGGVPNIPWK